MFECAHCCEEYDDDNLCLRLQEREDAGDEVHEREMVCLYCCHCCGEAEA